MTARRWPALLLIPALLVGGLLIDRRDRGDEPTVEVDADPDPDTTVETIDRDLMPVATESAAESSTWYCATGTGSGNDVVTGQLVVVANVSEEDRTGAVTVFPDEGDEVEQALDVPAGSRVAINTTSLTDARYAAALVELDGGGVTVTQFVFGSTGRETSECAASASASWHVASGATTSDAALYYAVFNPFPDEAIIDMTFEAQEQDENGEITEETRNPEDFQGYVVPGRSVRFVDIGEVVTRRTQVSATITARTGRVVVDRIQSYGGQDGIQGLAVSLAEPVAAETWFFPAGVSSEGLSEQFVIYNPSDTEATVDLEVAVDDPAPNGSVEPFELDVPRRSAVAISTSDEQWAHVPAVGYSVVVRSLNRVPVVAERTLVARDPAAAPGIATTAGTPLVARTWTIATGDLESAGGRWLNVQNPDPEASGRLTIRGVADGEVFDIDEIEVTGGQRLTISLEELTERAGYALVVESSIDVVVDETYRLDDPEGRSAVRAVPLAGTTAIPDILG
jgi:hypothetical protein